MLPSVSVRAYNQAAKLARGRRSIPWRCKRPCHRSIRTPAQRASGKGFCDRAFFVLPATLAVLVLTSSIGLTPILVSCTYTPGDGDPRTAEAQDRIPLSMSHLVPGSQ
jgi:hypothetical protein